MDGSIPTPGGPPGDSQFLRAWVEGASQHDRDATEALLRHCLDDIDSYIEMRAGSRVLGAVEAEDIRQEACVAIVHWIVGFEWLGEKQFFSWLRLVTETTIAMIARNLDLQKRRPPSGRLISLDQPVHGTVPGSGEYVESLRQFVQLSCSSPSQSARRAERFQRLRHALDRMSDDDRQIICMRVLAGISNRDTAQLFGIGESATSMRLSRALEKLRREFGSTESFSLLPDDKLDSPDLPAGVSGSSDSDPTGPDGSQEDGSQEDVSQEDGIEEETAINPGFDAMDDRSGYSSDEEDPSSDSEHRQRREPTDDGEFEAGSSYGG